MGVDLFFILSGFLITGVLLRTRQYGFRKYIGHFYLRRVQRILPPYVLVLIAATIVFGTAWLRYWYLYLGGMNFVLAYGLQRVESLPLWSLAVEEQFYLIWPIAAYFLSPRKLLWCAMALVATAPVLRYVCTPLFLTSFPIYCLLPFRMDCLAAGAVIALLWPRLRTRLEADAAFRSRMMVLFGMFVVVGLALLAIFQRRHITTSANLPIGNLLIYEATLLLTGGIMLLALSGFGFRFFTQSWLMWFGTISYGLYLVHQSILAILINQIKAAPFVALACSIGVAAASWYGLERRILGMGRSDAGRVANAYATPRS